VEGCLDCRCVREDDARHCEGCQEQLSNLFQSAPGLPNSSQSVRKGFTVPEPDALNTFGGECIVRARQSGIVMQHCPEQWGMTDDHCKKRDRIKRLRQRGCWG
jgi:hypothetical protein